MTVNTGDANISKVRLREQGSDPATPASSFGYLYEKTDGGLYFKNDGGTVVGPLATAPDLVTGTSTILDGLSSLVLGNRLSISVTGTVGFVNVFDGGWVDFGASSVVVGWAATPTVNIWYRVEGNLVFVSVRITGTSDATSVSFTVPHLVKNSTNYNGRFPTQIQDAGVVAATPGMLTTTPNSNVVAAFKDFLASSWTATGTKLIQGQFWYERA